MVKPSGNLHNLMINAMIGEQKIGTIASDVSSGAPLGSIKVLTSIVAPGLSSLPLALLATADELFCSALFLVS
jgi:hypothetical protein